MRPTFTLQNAIEILEAAPPEKLSDPGSTVGPGGAYCPIVYLAVSFDPDFARTSPLTGSPGASARAMSRARYTLLQVLPLTEEDLGSRSRGGRPL